MHMPVDLKIRFDHALKGSRGDIDLNEAQCKAISAEFGMKILHSLKARYSTKAKSGPKPVVTVTIDIVADVTQECAVSLVDFRHILSHDFVIDTIERQNVTTEVTEIGAKELGLNDLDEPDIIEDGHIDLGQYLIEAFGEIYDPYARAPGAAFNEPTLEKEPSPFAVLAKLVSKAPES
jgi:uncharacterized metal-binding protein YceD (DUF177 family)